MGINLKKEIQKQIEHCEMMLKITKQTVRRNKIKKRLDELRDIFGG